MIRVGDGLNVNVLLVAEGAAAPYFQREDVGGFATRLELPARARAGKLGLWGACARSPYDRDSRGRYGTMTSTTVTRDGSTIGNARCQGMMRDVGRPLIALSRLGGGDE